MEKDLDKKLYNDYLNGEKQAFEILYNKYKSKIEYFIYNIVHDYQKAEDLTQETFIYVMQNRMKENYSFKYYIYLKAKLLALNFISVENRRNEIAEKYLFNKDERIEKDIFEIISKEETKKELLESIELLGEKYKNAIYLTNIEELSYEETSKILGETLQNTKKLVYRGKRQLRKILIKKGFDKMNKVAKVLMIMIIASIFIGGIAYAVSNIKVSGKPVFEWFNVNFSDEYENYREEVQGEIIQAPSESSIELVSTVCDEGVVILEFDIKLSAEDKKYLKIGEPILTEEYINATDDEDSNTLEPLVDEETKKVVIDKETGKTVKITKKQEILNLYGDKKIEDSLYVGFNLKPGILEDEEEIFKRNWHWIIIDGEYNYVRVAPQSVKQISDYEYKLYQMYALTDKELGDKIEFNVTMKDFIITTQEMQYGDTETCLKIDGQFDINLSKEKALKNSKKIELDDTEVVYKNIELTQKIESVVVTPLQTIVKIHSIYENVDDTKLTDATREDHIGPNNYTILLQNGEIVNYFNEGIEKKITYSDGTEEKIGVGDTHGTRLPFENAKLEKIEYIFIENNENNSKIKIISQVGDDKNIIEYKDIGSFEIDLTREQKNCF